MSFVTVVANARTSLYDKKCMSFQMQSIHRSPILSLMCPIQLMNHFYDSPCMLVASLIFHWCTHNCYVWSLKWRCINIIQGCWFINLSLLSFYQVYKAIFDKSKLLQYIDNRVPLQTGMWIIQWVFCMCFN